METGQFATQPRAMWYDRNPTSENMWYNSANSPFAPTMIDSYTVPANRRAIVELMDVTVRRVTAASSLGPASGYFQLKPGGGAAEVMLIRYLENNTVGEQVSGTAAGSILLNPGDVFEMWATHLGTGGSVWLTLIAKISEYDA